MGNNSIGGSIGSSPHRDILEATPSQDDDGSSKARLVEECKNRAKACVIAKDYMNAKMLYQRALQFEPESAVLYSNISLCSLSMGQFQDALVMAQHAVEKDPTYVKGYWRLAASHLALKEPSAALEQINIAVGLEPTNRALLKEREKLEGLVVEQEEEKKKNKKKTIKKEHVDASTKKEMKKDVEMKNVETKEDVEMKDVATMKEGDSTTSTKKETKKDVEMKDVASKSHSTKDASKKATTTTTTTTEPSKKTTTTSNKSKTKKSSSNGTKTKTTDENDFTKSDHVRGYKIVNGKKTSFFHHEQTEEEKRLIGDIAPKRLDSGIETATSSTTTSTNNSNKTKNNTSAWNQAGTWEERNVSEWASKTIKDKLNAVTYQFPASSPAPKAVVSVTQVKLLGDGGHASVATVRGKKRYIYEYAVQIKWRIVGLGSGGGGGALTWGTLTFPDVDGTCVVGEGYDMVDYSVEKMGTPGITPLLDRFVKNGGFRDALHDALDDFVQEFRMSY